MKALVLAVAAFSLCTSPRCAAQEVVPVIHLSTDEAAKARQMAQDLKSAQDRDNRATTAWRNFHQMFQAAHPELPGMRFASDFRVAFTRNISSRPAEAVAVELTAEERQKAESLYREMSAAKLALEQAEKNWQDYQRELVADHVPRTGSANASTFTLGSGRSVVIEYPWFFGVAFTPDFRVAVPLRY